ncbi:hypothetical protein Ahy_A02g005280 [Arachis hypogaea]|uniref:Uncharacterized protein n=1 Tax=Arachis hypogaea TaxID=3818 RepID=A0A445E6N9_ARAHY|nr:hypothetical protein Ahy_A02g005280 [Arachis hypogaea]
MYSVRLNLWVTRLLYCCHELRWNNSLILCATNIFSPRKLESTSTLRHKKVQELVNFVGTCCTKGEAIDIGKVVFITIMNSFSNTLFSMDFANYGASDDDDHGSHQNFKELIEGILDDAGKINAFDHDIFDERVRLRASSNKNLGGTCDLLDSFLDFIEVNNGSADLGRHH